MTPLIIFLIAFIYRLKDISIISQFYGPFYYLGIKIHYMTPLIIFFIAFIYRLSSLRDMAIIFQFCGPFNYLGIKILRFYFIFKLLYWHNKIQLNIMTSVTLIAVNWFEEFSLQNYKQP